MANGRFFPDRRQHPVRASLKVSFRLSPLTDRNRRFAEQYLSPTRNISRPRKSLSAKVAVCSSLQGLLSHLLGFTSFSNPFDLCTGLSVYRDSAIRYRAHCSPNSRCVQGRPRGRILCHAFKGVTLEVTQRHNCTM